MTNRAKFNMIASPPNFIQEQKLPARSKLDLKHEHQKYRHSAMEAARPKQLHQNGLQSMERIRMEGQSMLQKNKQKESRAGKRNMPRFSSSTMKLQRAGNSAMSQIRSKDLSMTQNKDLQFQFVNELGTLGNLRNLHKVVTYQNSQNEECPHPRGKSQKDKDVSTQFEDNSRTLESHQLFKKQQKIVQNTTQKKGSEKPPVKPSFGQQSSTSFLAQKKIHQRKQFQVSLQNILNKINHKIEQDSKAPIFGKHEGSNSMANITSFNLLKCKNQQDPFSKTLGPEKMKQALAKKQEGRSQSKSRERSANIDKIIKKNLKKQREKEEKKMHEMQVNNERELMRKRELQIQNELVRQINREKTSKLHKNDNASDTFQASKQSLSRFSEIKGQSALRISLTNGPAIPESRSKSNIGLPARTQIVEHPIRENSPVMLSGFSRNSKGGINSGKSGRSGISLNTGLSGFLGAEQRGHMLQTSSSAHAGGKKDSINSNNVNNQQSQYVLSNHQGGALETSQRLDGSIFIGTQNLIQNQEIREQESQEESMREQNQISNGKKSSCVTDGRLNTSQKKSDKENEFQLPVREKSRPPKLDKFQPPQSFSSASNIGLDFLNVKKEIQNELKQVDKKMLERYERKLKQKSELTFYNDSSQRSLKFGKEQEKNSMTMLIRDSSIQELRLAQDSQLIKQVRSKSNSPQKMVQKTERHTFQNNQVRLRNPEVHKMLTQEQGRSLWPKKGQQSLKQPNLDLSEEDNLPKRQNMKKLIKNKMKEYNKQQLKERMNEISKVIKIHENLSKLDTYVKNQFHHKSSTQLNEAMGTQKRAKSRTKGRNAEVKFFQEDDHLMDSAEFALHTMKSEDDEKQIDMFSKLIRPPQNSQDQKPRKVAYQLAKRKATFDQPEDIKKNMTHKLEQYLKFTGELKSKKPRSRSNNFKKRLSNSRSRSKDKSGGRSKKSLSNERISKKGKHYSPLRHRMKENIDINGQRMMNSTIQLQKQSDLLSKKTKKVNESCRDKSHIGDIKSKRYPAVYKKDISDLVAKQFNSRNGVKPAKTFTVGSIIKKGTNKKTCLTIDNQSQVIHDIFIKKFDDSRTMDRSLKCQSKERVSRARLATSGRKKSRSSQSKSGSKSQSNSKSRSGKRVKKAIQKPIPQCIHKKKPARQTDKFEKMKLTKEDLAAIVRKVEAKKQQIKPRVVHPKKVVVIVSPSTDKASDQQTVHLISQPNREIAEQPSATSHQMQKSAHFPDPPQQKPENVKESAESQVVSSPLRTNAIDSSEKKQASVVDSSGMSNKQNLEKYSREKWIDVKEFRENQKKHQSPLKTFENIQNRMSDLTSQSLMKQLSMQSLNNFTFQEKRDTPGRDSHDSYQKRENLQDKVKLQKMYLNNLDLVMSSNSSLKLLNEGKGPVQIFQELQASEGRNNKFNYLPLYKLDGVAKLEKKPEVLNQEGSITWRSAKSGILAQLTNMSNSGALREDNDVLYTQMMKHQVPPFTAIESNRSDQQPVLGEIESGKALMFNKVLVDSSIQPINQSEAPDYSQLNQVLSQRHYQSGTEEAEQFHAHILPQLDHNESSHQSCKHPDKKEDLAKVNQTSQKKQKANLNNNPSLIESSLFYKQEDEPSGREMSGKFVDTSARQSPIKSGSESQFEETIEEVSQKVSQINIEKTIESGSVNPPDGESIEKLQKGSGSLNQFKQYQNSTSMPHSIMSLHTHKSQQSQQQSQASQQPENTLKKRQRSQEEQERDNINEEGVMFSQTCILNHEMLQGIQPSPKNNVLESNLDNIDLEVTETVENGPTTLISHLNDPNHDLQDEETKVASEQQTIGQRKSSEKSKTEQSNEGNVDAARGEHFLHYLESKLKEKKQENNSSFFDHSRASCQSDSQNPKRNSITSRPSNPNAAYDQKAELYKIQESAPPPEAVDHKDIELDFDFQKSPVEFPNSPQQEVQLLQNLQQIDKKKFKSLETDKEDKRPGRPEHSEELENYLNDEIKSDCISPSIKSKLDTLKSDKTGNEQALENVQQNSVNAQEAIISSRSQLAGLSTQQMPEMHITSNLTTLNLDGDNSSSDGLAQNLPPGQFGKLQGSRERLNHGIADTADEDQNGEFDPELTDLKKVIDDQKYLNQFRKRQQRQQEHQEKKKSIGSIEPIELDIQENSRSEDTQSPIDRKQSQPEQIPSNGSVLDKVLEEQVPGSSLRISDILEKKKNDLQKSQNGQPTSPSQAKQICFELVQDLVDSIDERAKACQMNQILTSIAKSEAQDQDEQSQKKLDQYMQSAIRGGIRPDDSQGLIQNELKSQAKPIEIINPHIIIDAKTPSEPQKDQSVEEYHEQILKSLLVKKQSVEASDVYLYLANSINQAELKSQIKQVIEMMQRKNIENDLIKSDDYCNELLAYLLQFEILNNEDEFDDALIQELNGGINYLTIFLKNLTTPVKKDLLEELERLAKQLQGNYEHFESCQDPLKHPILPIDMYLDIEKNREYEYQIAQRANQMNKLTTAMYNSSQSGITSGTGLSVSIHQESQHIFNKSIFDAMNESLTKFRPYGVIGAPVPWSAKYRRLQTDVDINSVDTERLFQMVKQEVFRWMSMQQGALNHKSELIFQYIDLHIPLMPEIDEKIQKIMLKQSIKETTRLDKKRTSKKPSIESETAKQGEGEEEKKVEEEPKEKGVEDQIESLKQIQEDQIIKYKKNLIDEATQELRQTKLSSQLHLEIIEDEHQWLNYEFEETQIRIDLSQFVFDQLLDETIQVCNQIMR